MAYKKNKKRVWPYKKSVVEALEEHDIYLKTSDIGSSKSGESWQIEKGGKIFNLSKSNGSLQSFLNFWKRI